MGAGASASVPEEYAEMATDLSPVQLERAGEHVDKLKSAGVTDPEVLTPLMQAYVDALKGCKERLHTSGFSTQILHWH